MPPSPSLREHAVASDFNRLRRAPEHRRVRACARQLDLDLVDLGTLQPVGDHGSERLGVGHEVQSSSTGYADRGRASHARRRNRAYATGLAPSDRAGFRTFSAKLSIALLTPCAHCRPDLQRGVVVERVQAARAHRSPYSQRRVVVERAEAARAHCSAYLQRRVVVERCEASRAHRSPHLQRRVVIERGHAACTYRAPHFQRRVVVVRGDPARAHRRPHLQRRVVVERTDTASAHGSPYSSAPRCDSR